MTTRGVSIARTHIHPITLTRPTHLHTHHRLPSFDIFPAFMVCRTRVALPLGPGACARSALLLGIAVCTMRTAWATGTENRAPKASEAASRGYQRPKARLLVAEMGSGNFDQTSTPCDVDVVGRDDATACFDDDVPSAGVADYPLDAPEVKIPSDGSPWGTQLPSCAGSGLASRPRPSWLSVLFGSGVRSGVHLAPAKAEGSYIITWYEGTAVVGPDSARVPDTSREAGSCQVFAQDGVVRSPYLSALVQRPRQGSCITCHGWIQDSTQNLPRRASDGKEAVACVCATAAGGR